jgi:hypothetical protein
MLKHSFQKPILITIDFVDGSTGEIISHFSVRKCSLSRSDFYKYVDKYLEQLNQYPSLAIQFHVVPPVLPLSLFDDISDDDAFDDLECLRVAGTECYILP